MAKTLGNCLSAESVSLPNDRLGASLVLDMLVRSRAYNAQKLVPTGFINVVSTDDNIDDEVDDILAELVKPAPLTVWAAKETLFRLRNSRRTDCDDIIETVYVSEDFGVGTEAFLNRSTPSWTGA